MTLDAQQMTDDPHAVPLRLRRGLALPIYTLALILSFPSDARRARQPGRGDRWRRLAAIAVS
jgi:hypothetical protein